jgi:hypothetical protein
MRRVTDLLLWAYVLRRPAVVAALHARAASPRAAKPLAAHKHSQLVAAAMRQLPNNLPSLCPLAHVYIPRLARYS